MLPVTSSKPLREPRVGLIFYTGLLWRKSNRSFLDSLLPVCLLGKLHWFTHLGQSYFYGPSAFMNRWISNFMKKVVLERERWQLRFHLNCHLLCPFYCMEGEFEHIITKISVIIKDNKNYCRVSFTDFYLVFPTNFRIATLPDNQHCSFTGILLWHYHTAWVTCGEK